MIQLIYNPYGRLCASLIGLNFWLCAMDFSPCFNLFMRKSSYAFSTS